MITRKIILSEVAIYFELNFLDLKNKKSNARIYSYPRQIYSTLCREFTNSSLSSIGEFINKDHSTVIHAIKNIISLSSVDKVVKIDLNNLRKKLVNYGDLGKYITKGVTRKITENSERVLDKKGNECYLIKVDNLQKLSNELYLILKQI